MLIVTSLPSGTFHEIVFNAEIDFHSTKELRRTLGYAAYRLTSGRTN